MTTQWILPGLGLAAMTVTTAALVRPGHGLLGGNKAWFALAWLGSEYAPWLAAIMLAGAVALAQQAGGEGTDSAKLAAALLFASFTGLIAVHRRARSAGETLDSALRAELGTAYTHASQRPGLRSDEKTPRLPSLPLPLPLRRRGIERIEDVPYPGGHERNTLDVYRAARACHAAPVVLHLHGGNWVGGNRRRQSLPLLHTLAGLGWIVIAASYRLGPAARLPAHLVDCKSALAWIRGHVAALGGDPRFVVVTGSGAGAHLAALLALTFDRDDLQPGFEHVDTRPAACVGLHGVYDLADHGRHFPARRARMRWLQRNVMPDAPAEDVDAWASFSPTSLVRPDAPPFFILHGAHDSLSPPAGAREFAQRLRRISAQPVVHVELPGAHHAWDSAVSHRALHTAHAVARFLDWCAARHYRLHGPRRDSTDRAWS